MIVIAKGLIPNGTYKCIFIPHGLTNPGLEKCTPLNFISDHHFSRRQPRLIRGEYQLSIRGAAYNVNLTTSFLVYPSFRPENFHPKSGPVYGGTLITIFGQAFPKHVSLFCKFGSNSLVKATYVVSKEISFVTPTSNHEPLNFLVKE